MKHEKFADWLMNCQFVLEMLSPKLNHFDGTYIKIYANKNSGAKIPGYMSA